MANGILGQMNPGIDFLSARQFTQPETTNVLGQIQPPPQQFPIPQPQLPIQTQLEPIVQPPADPTFGFFENLGITFAEENLRTQNLLAGLGQAFAQPGTTSLPLANIATALVQNRAFQQQQQAQQGQLQNIIGLLGGL